VAGDDRDAAFIFFWISFGAAYADDQAASFAGARERNSFDDFFEKVIALDSGLRTYDPIWVKFSGNPMACYEFGIV